MNPVKSFTAWASFHPIKSHACNSAISFFLLAIICHCNRPDLWWVFCLLVGAMGIVWHFDLKRDRAISALLAALLLLPASSTGQSISDSQYQFAPTLLPSEIVQPPNAGIVVGCLLIIGAGVVIGGCVVPWCKKNLDKPEKPEQEEELAMLGASGEGSFAAIKCLHEKNCGPVDLAPPPEGLAQSPEGENTNRAVRISGWVVDSGGGAFAGAVKIQRRERGDMVDIAEWLRIVNEEGLPVSYGGGSQTAYSVNKIPCTADESPVIFGAGGGFALRTDQPVHNVVIERSSDFRNWQRIFSARVPVGHFVWCSDMSGDFGFYRMEVVP